MKRSLDAQMHSNDGATKQPATPIHWTTQAVAFPLRDDAKY